MKLTTPFSCSSPFLRKLLGLGCAFASAFAANSYGAAGDLYVSDLATNSIIVYKPNGTASTFATGFDQPQGLAFDQAKNLYVADKGTGSIFKITQAGTKTVFVTGLVTPVGRDVRRGTSPPPGGRAGQTSAAGRPGGGVEWGGPGYGPRGRRRRRGCPG